MSVSPGRRVAFDVLMRVAQGGYASDLLAERSGGLDARDAGLAAEIVFGVLRYRAQIDCSIREACGNRRFDEEVRTALRMGTYQLRYLERVPAHAAVGESVALVKQARKASASGLVNAVLRQAARDSETSGRSGAPADRGPRSWPSREVELSSPEWLLERWQRQYGREAAEGIARAALRAPEKYFRGERMQDIGSQAIVPLLRLEPGQRFLDVCAAPGNKTAQALETDVKAVACDVHWHRLQAMQARGLGPGARHGGSLALVALDATHPLPFATKFDRILVDAPCSGTGTLGRNPEIKWKLRPEDLADLHRRQVTILDRALAVLAPGGLLVYATCSLEPEENEQVVEAGLAGPWPVVAGPTLRRLPGRDPGDGFFAAVLESKVPAND